MLFLNMVILCTCIKLLPLATYIDHINKMHMGVEKVVRIGYGIIRLLYLGTIIANNIRGICQLD